MTTAQHRLYLSLWIAAKAADPAADRHTLHIRALGYDKSSKAFTNSEFSKVKAVFEAVADPTNLDAQIDAEDDSKKRLLYGIRRVCSALAADDAWALGIAREMGREGKFKVWQRDLADLPDFILRKLIVAIKADARRRWPEQANVLRALQQEWLDQDLDYDAAESIARRVMKTDTLRDPREWSYDDTLAVLGETKQFTGVPA